MRIALLATCLLVSPAYAADDHGGMDIYYTTLFAMSPTTAQGSLVLEELLIARCEVAPSKEHIKQHSMAALLLGEALRDGNFALARRTARAVPCPEVTYTRIPGP